ncbi:MAG TPA: alpha/beta fold hydrolase [Bryobacteraceae bacterium]|jgi:dipeptidyl aminopeptidase/acylaminoacyl peptidase|nr:alpha/beta fold hydrolase [Bryobacteraceae bacterium]
MPTSIPFLFCISLLAQNTPPATTPAAGGGGGRGGAAAAATAPAPGAGQQVNPNDTVLKALDDIMWVQKLSDIADVDKVAYTSLPAVHTPNRTAPGAGNPLIIRAYTFIPKKMDRSKKQPLLVLAHQGLHGNVSSVELAHIIREMMEQGYAVIAPDYRGSTGYGQGFYNQVDYGGREVDDVLAGKSWMLEKYSFLDPKRVGAVGWSHGGLITLMEILAHPDAGYAVAYAGVPVSDLVLRMGYESAAYQAQYSAAYHIGKSVRDDIKEYEKRSPITYAAKLATPLLIHTNTNDEDVNVLEVKRMIMALKAEGKQFESKIYEDAPGGHMFNRLDTKLARDSREEIYAFLAKYLKN